jgi:tRNA(adenine34) deaminase
VNRRRTKSAQAGRRWSAEVRSVSTYPPPGLFTKDAETIARVMATKRVSPKGLGSGIRMLQFFINRAGKNLPARQRRELERAKRLLQARRAKAREERT